MKNLDSFFNWLNVSISSGVFLTIGIIAFVVLVIATIVDGVLESFDIWDGPISLTTISGFAAIFGFVTFGFIQGGTPVGVAALIGVFAGLLGAVGTWFLSSFLKNSSVSSSYNTDSVVGQEASVTVRVPGGEGLGEIAYFKRGDRHTFSARSANFIPAGSQVRIISVITESSVLVEEVTPLTQTPNEKNEENN